MWFLALLCNNLRDREHITGIVQAFRPHHRAYAGDLSNQR